MDTFEVIYDISVSLGAEAIDWPGLLPYSRELILRIENGDAANLSKLVMTAHAGTHLDTPAHFIPNGKNLDGYSAKDFVLPAQVVIIEDKQIIRSSELQNLDIEPGDALLFKTYNSTSGQCANGVFTENFVEMSLEAADFCVGKKVSLLGIDYNSIEKDVKSHPVHNKILGNGILILESINLKEVPPGRYTLFCPPLKIKGAEGSPARAILMC